jgi:molybdopterin-binding protein
MRISARNQLKATVTSVARGASIANVELDVAGQRVVASTPSRPSMSSASPKATE